MNLPIGRLSYRTAVPGSSKSEESLLRYTLTSSGRAPRVCCDVMGKVLELSLFNKRSIRDTTSRNGKCNSVTSANVLLIAQISR